MKNRTRIIPMFVSLLILSAMLSCCSYNEYEYTTEEYFYETEAETETEEITEEVPSMSDTAAEVFVQYYDDPACAEVIKLYPVNDDRPGAAALNADIDADIWYAITKYDIPFDAAYGDTDNDEEFVRLFAYSFTDENFIQIYHTVYEPQDYSTEGTLYGYIYDVPNDNYLKPEDFYIAAGYESAEAVAEEAKALWLSNNPENEVGDIELRTVHLTENDYDYTVSYLLEMEISLEGYESTHRGFYQYTPDYEEIEEMNEMQLFSYGADKYDPPLHYQDSWTEYFLALGGE
jgi:hypothetical protein